MKKNAHITKVKAGAILLVMVLASNLLNAQDQKVGSLQLGNNGTFNTDAQLDLQAADKGLLLPRVALTGTANASPLSTHTAGMVVYNTATTGDVSPGYYYNNGTTWTRITDDTNNEWVDASEIGMDGFVYAKQATANGDTIVITDDGKMGIGTTSPTNKLHLHQDNSGYANIQFTNNSSGTDPNGGFRMGIGSDENGYIFMGDEKSLSFGTNDTLRMTINPLGNVGIGTTTPTEKLDIDGNINISRGSSIKMAGTDILTANTNQSLTLGQGAGAALDASYYNVAIGYNALSNTTGNYNTAEGHSALYSNTTGIYNTAQGARALYSNTTGVENTAQGERALYNNTTGGANTAQGKGALYYNTTGAHNTATGVNTLSRNTTGHWNAAHGREALFNNTTGGYNVALGAYAGRNTADGENTITNSSLYLGYDTKAQANDQTNQIVIGHSATGLGSNTVVLGNGAIRTTALRGNVGIGTTDPVGHLHVQGTSYNVMDRVGAGDVANLFLRKARGTLAAPEAVQMGDITGGVVFSGHDGTSWRYGGASVHSVATEDWTPTSTGAGLSLGTTENGTTTRTTKLFIDDTGKVGIGTSAPNVALDVIGDIEYTGTITDVSDKKLKENVEKVSGVLPQLQQIQAYTYNMIGDTAKTREYGVFAQDVQKVFPEMVSIIDQEGHLGMSYMQLVPVLLEAIKEQQKTIDEQKAKYETLLKRIEALEADK